MSLSIESASALRPPRAPSTRWRRVVAVVSLAATSLPLAGCGATDTARPNYPIINTIDVDTWEGTYMHSGEQESEPAPTTTKTSPTELTDPIAPTSPLTAEDATDKTENAGVSPAEYDFWYAPAPSRDPNLWGIKFSPLPGTKSIDPARYENVCDIEGAADIDTDPRSGATYIALANISLGPECKIQLDDTTMLLWANPESPNNLYILPRQQASGIDSNAKFLANPVLLSGVAATEPDSRTGEPMIAFLGLDLQQSNFDGGVHDSKNPKPEFSTGGITGPDEKAPAENRPELVIPDDILCDRDGNPIQLPTNPYPNNLFQHPEEPEEAGPVIICPL